MRALTLILVALLALSGRAAADDKGVARQAYIEGSRYYDLNQFAEALEAFKRAYFNFEDPVILFNIAQCHRALGHKKDAVEFYRSYLRKAPEARNREDVQRMITELNTALDKEKALAVAPPQGTLPTETRPVKPAEKPHPAAVEPPAKPPEKKPAAVTLTAPPPQRTDKPVWKRAWLWGVVGAVVVVGVAVGVGVGLGVQPHPPRADNGVSF